LLPLGVDLAAVLASDPGAVEDPQVIKPTSVATPVPADGRCQGCRGALWCPTCRRWFEMDLSRSSRLADDLLPALFDSGAATELAM
jgi:hypothetical protein